MNTVLDRPEIAQAQTRAMPRGGASLSSARVNAAIESLRSESRSTAQVDWLRAVARRALALRPDLGPTVLAYLAVEPSSCDPLEELSIGEIGVVYEALLALSDRNGRKAQGQYFTPDDVAAFMASQSRRFERGTWLDPCCGVGNLAWHLADVMPEPSEFVSDSLTLMDLDGVALKTAVVLIAASFVLPGDTVGMEKLANRARNEDFLALDGRPVADFIIINPPYAVAKERSDLVTGHTREQYAFFLEQTFAQSRGYVAITPAAHLGSKKYKSLRGLFDRQHGGEVLVFDNVPDTCFRGYKYGSVNTSTTNFVRAAITSSAPRDNGWKITPILRWTARSRELMWEGARSYLCELQHGPELEWLKLMPGTEHLWAKLQRSEVSLNSIVVKQPTPYSLDVASTPRYYISASKRTLDRGSKHVLYFDSESSRNVGYLLLNSSLPYWWWRVFDGGITLARRHLLTLPIPTDFRVDPALIGLLELSEGADLVTKLNAGRQNENVRRPKHLVALIDKHILGSADIDFRAVYTSDMFASERVR